MRSLLLIILTAITLWRCERSLSLGNHNSPAYQREELLVYNQIMDALVDSPGFEYVDSATQVFGIRDTLYASEPMSERSFLIHEVVSLSKHRFFREADTLRLKPHEQFSGRWLRLSRVAFDTDLTFGILSFNTWCGDLCGAGYYAEVEKVNNRWVITKFHITWIS